MLTAIEVVEVRRQAGYSGFAVAADDPLVAVLPGLPSEVEGIVRAHFLPGLAQLERDLLSASATLDTSKAAVWERNAAEVAERTGLYRARRLELCRFLGIPPGPGILDMVVVVPGTGTGTDPITGGGGLTVVPDVLVL